MATNPRFIPTEDHVARSCLMWLQHGGWKVTSYHPPGGQASKHIRFEGGRYCFPDLIAVSGDEVVVVECKARKSRSDLTKLRRILADCLVQKQVAEICGHAEPRLRVAHAFFSDEAESPEVSVDLLVVSSRGKVTLVKGVT